MNSFLNTLKDETNIGYTENGSLKRLTTKSDVLDMFALGGAYRNRTDEDCIVLFKNAFEENEELAMKCLFYLRDCRGGQGERRFFRICFRWLADHYPEAAIRNIQNITIYGRADDILYSCIDTPIEKDALLFIKKQLALDITCETPSLLAKWLPSENASSKETKKLGTIVRSYLEMTHKEYRKILSVLRSRINIVEKLMSENRWDEIKFDKIPSRAGLIYKNAFARRDIIAKKYEAFIKDKDTKVNADVLYPYEIIGEAVKHMNYWSNKDDISDTERAALEKYWENQKDILKGKPLNMLCVCDTSGSMCGSQKMAPINVAIGLSMYAAERAGGPFHNHYISFSSRPQLIKIEGVDFYDKVKRIYKTNLCDNTNLEAVFKLLKRVALNSDPKDVPDTIIVISDMEIDHMTTGAWKNKNETTTGMERIRKDWAEAGLKLPRLVYWNVDARQNTFLDSGDNVSFVSGASPVIFEQILTGKTGWDLCLETLNNKRYSCIY